MNCEEANLLITARIGGNLTSDLSATLDAHLAECEACRVTLSEMELQDAALMRAFMPRREAADALADRVSQALFREEAVSQELTASSRHPERSEGSLLTWTEQTVRYAHGDGLKASVFRSGIVSRRFVLVAGWAVAAAVGFLAAMVVTRLANPRQGQYLAQTVVPVRPVAHLTLATGEVFTRREGRNTWRPISPSDPIDLLAAVRTADAKCELRLPDGSCVRLNSGTEARFTSGRTVSVSAGEVWSAVPRDAALLCVSAGQTRVTAGGSGSDKGTQFDLTKAADAATVTVQRGSADVVGNGPPTTVHGGQVLRAPSPSAVFACSAAPDPLQASRWQDELLVLKPGDDPEVAARVDRLLAGIVTDRGASESPGPTEQDVRARGQAWCTPFACYIRAQPAGIESRRTAARLLADLAPPSRIPDLIGLLADADGQVRYQAAVALRRLTGQTLGYAPDRCAAGDAAAVTAWREWWEQNKLRYREGK